MRDLKAFAKVMPGVKRIVIVKHFVFDTIKILKVTKDDGSVLTRHLEWPWPDVGDATLYSMVHNMLDADNSFN